MQDWLMPVQIKNYEVYKCPRIMWTQDLQIHIPTYTRSKDLSWAYPFLAY